jgi:hypothetical protein
MKNVMRFVVLASSLAIAIEARLLIGHFFAGG